MYGIFTYIWLIFMVNVGNYTIHGSYGYYIYIYDYIIIYVFFQCRYVRSFVQCHISPRISVRLCRSGSFDELNIDSICAGKLDHTWNYPLPTKSHHQDYSIFSQ